MKRIYRFSKDLRDWDLASGDAEAKKVLGGKGAGLVKMAADGLPVPPGFTITTDVCNTYRQHSADEGWVAGFMDKLMDEVVEGMKWLEGQFGYMPLVSVRSGAPVSMPGMMDTILNVGLTETNFYTWELRLGKRAVADSLRRLIQMLGATAYGVPHEVFEFQLAKAKKMAGATQDTDLNASELETVVEYYLAAFEKAKGVEFPVDSPYAQLRAAIKAVFDSWMNPRAIEYRRLNNLSEDMGTAVNIQAMVFGNMGEDSGTGVLFTRDPSTGKPGMMGEFLTNAQGEDVVAGIRTPQNINLMDDVGGVWDGIYSQLLTISKKLESVYRDMVDIEFTVQKGELFILQSRTGKRSARAAFKIAVDLVAEKAITRLEALSRLTPEQFKAVSRPMIDPAFKDEPSYLGLPACPGVVTGKPVYSSEDAVDCKEPCILVTHETTPDDIKGMNAALGILTQTGGATSHAAVVARAMDKACVVGCGSLSLTSLKGATKVTIDGLTGRVWVDVDVPVVDASSDESVKTVSDWCLTMLGACDGSMDFDAPQRIMVANFWGDASALDDVLDRLAALPTRSHVLLDLWVPGEFMPESDNLLADCFGLESDEPAFVSLVVDRLLSRKDLAGLQVSPAHGIGAKNAESLVSNGYRLQGQASYHVPVVVPRQYAVYTVLSR